MTLGIKKSSLIEAVALVALTASPANAGDAFTPTPTFVIETRDALSVEPQDLALNGKFAYVLGTNAAGVSEIELRDASSLALLRSKALKFEAEDIVTASDGAAVYVIGNSGSATRFEALDPKLNTIGALSIRSRLGHPSLSTTPDNLVVLTALRTDYSEGFFGAIDVNRPESPTLRDDFYASEARKGAMNGWLDTRSNAIFLNAAWDSRLLALAAGKSYVMSEYGVQAASGASSEPYAISAQLGHEPCRGGRETSFLVADMTRNVLTLVDFNEAFQSLDVLSFVEFNLAPIRTRLDRLDGTDIREPAGVVSASCDQSVVLLGSKSSYEVAQFARNENLGSLERVGTIKLPGRPKDLSVDANGTFAIAISAENRAIMRLSNKAEDSGSSRIIGNADVRELQRILTEAGLPVGSIDGIIGVKTMRAISLAERRLGIVLDTANVQQSVETLKMALDKK